MLCLLWKIKRKALLKVNVAFTTLLIGAEGTKTPRKCYRIFFVRGRIRGCNSVSCGNTGQGRPAGAKRRGGSRHARGKRSACSGNPQQDLTEPKEKGSVTMTFKEYTYKRPEIDEVKERFSRCT